MKILGYVLNDAHLWPLNFVLLMTRNYIFQSSRKGCVLNIFALQLAIKRKYLEQQMLQRINLKERPFNGKWNLWSHLFDDI